MTGPHHVALIQDGRVLVDETGTLPSFLPEQNLGSLARSLRLVGAHIAVAPTVKLSDGRRVHFVGTRGSAPAGCFVPPADLADTALATTVALAVDELDPVRTPAGRPPWFRPGWFEPWRAAYPHADIGRILLLAPLVDLVFQAITFDDIVDTTEPVSRWELGGVVAGLLRTLPAKVAGVR